MDLGLNPPFDEGVTQFNQPVLASDGTVGGNSFAVFTDYNTSDAWKAFDGTLGSSWRIGYVNHYIGWYNPKPITITHITLDQTGNGNNEYITNYTFSASNDYQNWVVLQSGGNSSLTPTIYVPVAKQNPYNYYKLHVNSVANGQQMCTINELKIFGTCGGLGDYPMGISALMAIKYE